MQNNDLMYDPHFLANLAIMRGTPRNEAISQAAIDSHNMQQTRMQQQKHAQEQFMAQQLPKILHELQGKNPYEAAELLARAGLKGPEIGLFLERLGLGGGKTAASQTFTGADKMRYELFKDEQGQTMSRPIPGQAPIKPKVNATEQKDIIKIRERAKAALNSIRELHTSREARKVLQGQTDENTGPNTALAKLTDPDLQQDRGKIAYAAGEIADFSLYTPEAREAKQIISKVNAHLIQNAIKALEGTDTRASVFLEKIMKQGTPLSHLGERAAGIVLDEFEIIMADRAITDTFISKYADAHGTTQGAEAALTEFKKTVPTIDPQTGLFNEKAIELIPQFIRGTTGGGEDFIPELQSSYVEPPKSEWEMARDILREDGTIQ